MRPRVALAAASAVFLTASLAACSKNTGDNGDGSSDTVAKQAGGIGTVAQSKGPAKPVKGAAKGGTIYLLQDKDFEHLDPQRVYVNNASVFSRLFSRQLTTFVDDGKGHATLVGDLATGPGKDVSSGDQKCTAWQYTLKDGLKYQDGSPITAADVAYGVARSFSPDLAEGPHYIQKWLTDKTSYNEDYKGPYNGAKDVPPGVTVKGDKQITFHFKSPHCDMPYAASWGTTTPLPKSQDKKTKLDFKPFSEGPYKFKTYHRGEQIVMVRNKYWDPKTDPLRHDYPDKFVVTLGISSEQQSNRMIADSGKDKYGIMQASGGVTSSLLPRVQGHPEFKDRILSGFTQFNWYVAINNRRVTDLKVRQALNYGINKKAYIQTLGGSAKAAPSSTLMSPTTTGFEKYDAYPYNLEKAKKLLGGKHPHLVYAYTNTELGQKYATKMQSLLQKIGFKITLKPIDGSKYYTVIGRKDNPYDLYLSGWGSDWPSGATIIPPVYDGRTIQKAGNQDQSYFNSAEVNKKIDEISKMDPAKAPKHWMALDKEIMTKYAPVVPLYYQKEYVLIGSKVGGCYLGTASGWPELTDVYAKK